MFPFKCIFFMLEIYFNNLNLYIVCLSLFIGFILKELSYTSL